MAVLEGRVRKPHDGPEGPLLDDDMLIAGRDEDAAGPKDVAVGGFLHVEGAYPVEALRELLGKARGHMLNDEDRLGKVGVDFSEDLAEGVGPARRYADRDDLDGSRAGAGA